MTSVSELEALLVLQEHDGALDRLRHRYETLPERAARARGEAEIAALDTRIGALRSERDTLAREEQKLDDEVRSLAAKAKEVDSKMYSGEISSPRELQSMQADIDQLKKRQGELENRELELMEAREPLDAGLTTLDAERAALEAELARLQVSLSEAEGVINAEAQVERAARDQVVSGIDAALVAEYTRCRALTQGTGVARLVGTTCQSCHLSIPATEVERIKKSGTGELAYCDNCGAILVP